MINWSPDIQRFTIEKFARDQGDILKRQFTDEKILKNRMYKRSCVPVLDITPVVVSEYIPEKEVFKYSVTMYGVKVDNIEEYEGWLSGRLIPSTIATKSERLLKVLEL